MMVEPLSSGKTIIEKSMVGKPSIEKSIIGQPQGIAPTGFIGDMGLRQLMQKMYDNGQVSYVLDQIQAANAA